MESQPGYSPESQGRSNRTLCSGWCRLAPVLRRDLHEEAVGIPEIDRRAVGIGLIRISRFGVRQLAIDFVSEAFGSDPIHMVDCHCEMCDHALLSGRRIDA